MALNAQSPVLFFSVAILGSEPDRFDETANVWMILRRLTGPVSQPKF